MRAKPLAKRSPFRPRLLSALLALLTVALYWPATKHGFVSYDDPNYVTANSVVQSGLSWQGLKWAWAHPVSVNWHPVTVMSHMVDCQVFGLRPWGPHLVNVVLHALNAVLVFVVLQQMTGASWRSLVLAALFAVHPLRVESVAWVAERKDVLCAFFGLLSLWAYIRYAEQSVVSSQWSVVEEQSVVSRQSSVVEGRALPIPSDGRPRPTTDYEPRTTDCASRFTFRVSRFYLLALIFFVLGLLSKPMLVTWPFVLLLLDYWPLKRCRPESRVLSPESRDHSPRHTVRRLGSERQGLAAGERREEPRTARKSEIVNRILLEKLPFLLVAVVFSVVTFLVQKHGGAVAAGQGFPPSVRCTNALVSYCRYLGKLLWPTGLAVYYPHPNHWPLGLVIAAGALIAGVTVLLFVLRRRWPFLLVGWLWYCGMLVPVIGLVQVGGQAMADRYTYLPSVGVLIMAVWGAYALTCRWRYHALVLAVGGTTAIVLCLVLTRQQLAYWRDSEALFRRALEVTRNNPLAHDSLGTALSTKGQVEEAISHYLEALRLAPDYPEAHYNLGNELASKGQIDEAISHYRDAIRLKPSYAEACYNLGRVLAANGRTDEAIGQFQAATRAEPDYADAYFNLGILLAGSGQLDAALSTFLTVIRLKPGDAEAHNLLGLTLARLGRTDQAISQYRQALRLKPEYAEARTNLARAMEQRDER